MQVLFPLDKNGVGESIFDEVSMCESGLPSHYLGDVKE